jgi:tetratricopeptide (TPR) repeat protein
MGAYLDDDSCVYRYFGSIPERIHHNLVVDEGGREIRLVPDSYFNAHANASIALGMLGRNDEALAHADTCIRLAPTSTYAALRRVRVLEAESRIFEAADLIINTLRHAITAHDASICHYRLAYMEWKLGREDLAAACYVRSMGWHASPVAAQAREELDDLIKSIPTLERPTEEQADALLAREGIPLGCVRSDGERMLGAAVACMDDGLLFTARPLMESIFEMNGDDVVVGVYRSLRLEV